MMEDAYVIGIRLALENGISAGVASIRQELSALDAQIAVTASGLQTLAAVSAATSAAALGDLKRLAQTPVPRPEPASAPDHRPAPQPARPNHPPATERMSSQTRPALAASPTLAPIVTQADPKTAAPAVTTIRVDPQATAPAAISRQPVPQPPVQSPSKAPVPAQPIFRIDPPQALPGPFPLARPAPSVPVPAPPAKPATISPQSLPTPRPAPDPRAASAADTPAAPQPAAATAPEMALPRAPLQPDPSVPPRPIAPQSHQAATVPASGDVFLDGSRLGSWMIRTLSREASRPPSGGTGFDPRMGITWPGAQQGG